MMKSRFLGGYDINETRREHFIKKAGVYLTTLTVLQD